MEVFNKLYSQVSNTVSQLSGVLPGNPVTREFDATVHVGSAGPGLLWKIYKGNKCSTKQEASIFVFEKRQLDKWNKTDKEIILETLRRGITQLTKIRHPQILTVQHPLEESRESLAFATEPVFASLANLLGKTYNMPQPANLSDYKFYDIEIKYGLLKISEGLTFLHNDMKLLHKNICPESIIINQNGIWKIFGFDFCVHNVNSANNTPHYPYEGYCPTLPNICQPNLDYMAPECILNQTHSTASDMFSLGMLVYVLCSPGNQPILSIKDIQQFRSRAQQLKNLNSNKLQCISADLREYVKSLLNVSPEVRPDAHDFIKIPYFQDIGVKTLNYLDSLLQLDNLQKSQFYKDLPQALPKLPHRVKLNLVLTFLVRDLVQPIMIPFVLPNILHIAQDCSKSEYCNHILPHLKPIMKIMEPVQILLIMLQNMELLLKLTPAEDIQQHVLPMLYRGLDSDCSQIHELCLTVLPTFAALLDHSNVKNNLLPRIKRLCLATTNLSVRVNCLLCIGKLLEHLDKWLVLDDILPFLPQIPSREPAVLMGILGIYKLSLNHKKLGISKEVIATRILPFLIPLSIETGLTINQFNAIVSMVKEMFQIVENEHRIKLEQLNSIKEQENNLSLALTSTVTSTATQQQQSLNRIEFDQPFLGLGDGIESNKTDKLSQNQTNKLVEPIKVQTTSKPAVDLSSSLTDWNNSSLTNLSTLSSPNNNNSSFGNNSNLTNFSSLSSPVAASNNNISTFMANNNTSFMNLSLNSNNSNVWGGGNSSSGFQSINKNHSNWGGLNTLNPINNNNSMKIPMNQMMSQNQPLLPSSSFGNSNNNSSNSNPLSKDDIMDLLS